MQSQVRPHLDLTFENILSHINTVYVLRTRPGAYDRGRAATEEPEFNALRLKVSNREPIGIMQIISINFQGQMMYIPESEMVIFLCYPSVMNLDDLTKYFARFYF